MPASYRQQFALLGKRRFLPLFLTQFFGAFNDQVYQKAFVALVTYRLAEQVDMSIAQLGVIASGLFILPFAIITPTAGQIADRVDKAKMMVAVKAWEIVVMALATYGFWSENIAFLYFVLFLMGAQSAVFAPIKYSVLPQYLKRDELLGGNGLVQAFTFLAIIFGTIIGNELILNDNGVLIISCVVMATAVAGLASAWFAPPAPPMKDKRRKIDWVFPRAIWKLIKLVRTRPKAFRTILCISWFWFLGATFLSLLPAIAKENLGADEEVLTVLLAGFSVGVAIGAIGSGLLSRGEVSLKLPPIGAMGICIMVVELWFVTPTHPPEELMNRQVYFSDPIGWRILADFVLIAVFAGLYVTPLNAMLQVEAEEQRRAQFIAGSNVVDAAMMVMSSVISGALIAVGLTSIDVLALVSVTGLPVAFLVAREAPDSRLGRLALAAWPRPTGPEL